LVHPPPSRPKSIQQQVAAANPGGSILFNQPHNEVDLYSKSTFNLTEPQSLVFSYLVAQKQRQTIRQNQRRIKT
jgi:hypothetical protein